MKTGDKVQVFQTSPKDAVPGELLIYSENGCSTAIRLEEKPDWLSIEHGMFLGFGGLVMLASKKADADFWADVVTGQKFQITPLGG